ncbi:MAG TPA: S41 family peptidase [Planctomycetota bacterium]
MRHPPIVALTSPDGRDRQDTDTVNFSEAVSGCSNTANSTIIAHEWGHGLDDRYDGISQIDGLGEGWGDICGMYLLDSPLLGSGYWIAGVPLRNGNKTTQYSVLGLRRSRRRRIVDGLCVEATRPPRHDARAAVRGVFIADDNYHSSHNYRQLRAVVDTHLGGCGSNSPKEASSVLHPASTTSVFARSSPYARVLDRLLDRWSVSYAESVLGIIEAYKLGEIVGGTTAGTNGNVNPFDLPGGYSVSWTGMKVLKHDGSRHHGVGIAPTVPVAPTAAGIAAGRDEVLEKAVEVLKAAIAR